MKKTHRLGDQPMTSLWHRAQAAGISRRRFLVLLASGGALAVLSACQAKVAPVTPPATPSPSTTPSPPATPPRLINKPTPEAFFTPLGSNAEMRFEVMANRAYLMSDSLFFVRNHTSTPLIDIKTWRLRLEGDGVQSPFELNYDDLLKMPTRTVTRFVECAGNGRSFFASLLNKPADGGQWHLGAYGVAEWTGVPLAELLKQAGLKKTAVDVMPTGMDSSGVERPMSVDKATSEDVLLAYLMNGEILQPDHGFPARVIAPGWIGVNSIKWVGKITVSEKPIYVEKNTKSYVLIGPDYQPQPPAEGPIITDQTIKSACALPWPATLKSGSQKVVGYAWSAFGAITRVEVSLDGGRTFQNASLTGPNIERAGTRWEFSFIAKPGEMTITPRATDDKDHTQPDASRQKWNKLGYLFGAVVPHPVNVVG
ncbi:MAG: sulfite oxidase [Chloroflexi bacterium]|nr:sulfite oxidase [Chloroflexota bacterium]